MSGKGKQETRSREECLWEVEKHLDYRLSIPVSLENVLRIIPTGAGSAPELNLHQINSDEARQIDEFCGSVDLLESSAIVLRNIDTGAYRIIRPANSSRYTDKGRKNTQGRVRGKLRHNKGGHGIFLTLTIAPRKMTREKAWANIGRMMSEFLERLNKHRQRKQSNKKRRLTYVWTLEEQAGTGYPHIHMFFPWLKWLEYNPVLADLWGHGIIDLKNGHANISRYIVKYITKMEGWSLLGLSYLWEFRRRLYSFSRKFSIPGQKKEPMYELIGAFNKIKGFGFAVVGGGYYWAGDVPFDWVVDPEGELENPGEMEYLKSRLWHEGRNKTELVNNLDRRESMDHTVARCKVGRAYRNHGPNVEGIRTAKGYKKGTVAEGQEGIKVWELREGVC